MAEYLKRDDVLNNADIITVQTREYGTIDVVPVEYLADLPTVDVVEVVRCKDCKHWKLKGTDPVFDRDFGECICPHWENDDRCVETDEVDFCSYGERN